MCDWFGTGCGYEFAARSSCGCTSCFDSNGSQGCFWQTFFGCPEQRLCRDCSGNVVVRGGCNNRRGCYAARTSGCGYAYQGGCSDTGGFGSCVRYGCWNN